METPAVVLLLAAAALHAQSGAAVEGRVVSTAGNTAVKRAVVTLRGETETYLCQSDANGRFALTGVVPGRYRIEAEREGFESRPEAPVVIRPGAAALEVHLIPLALIAGRIVDEAGDPVPDADVEAMHYRYQAGRKQLRSTARAKTNDRGEYLIADLAPSRYYVRASDVEHIPPIIGEYTDRGPKRMQLYAPAYYPGTRDPDRAAMLSVAPAGELQHVDLQIHRESVYSIRGRTAPGTSVQLIRRFNEPGSAYATRPMEGGQFEIWGVTAGKYAVAGSRQSAVVAMRKVEVVSNDLEGVDLANPTAIALSGTVRGQQVPGLRVVLESEEAAALDLSAAADTAGNFTVNAQPDSYIVHVQGEGAWLKSMRIGDREIPDHRIVPGRLAGALTLEASTESGEIAGTVSDGSGQPAAGIRITLVPDQSLPYWPDLAQVATSGEGGAFTLPHVVPGSYRLFAVADAEAGAPLDPEFRKPFEESGVAVQVAAGGKASVALRAVSLTAAR